MIRDEMRTRVRIALAGAVLLLAILLGAGTARAAEPGPGDLIRIQGYQDYTYEEWVALDGPEQAAEVRACKRANNRGACRVQWVPVDSDGNESMPRDLELRVGENGQGRTAALVLFDYAMGSSGSCLSCNFMSFFMIALTDFSLLIFKYFINFFVNVIPLCLLIWLGYRVAKLMVTGGEDGREFIMGVSSKLALFVMVWLFATATGEEEKDYAWYVAGPVFLENAFGLSNEIRGQALGYSTRSDDTTGTVDPSAATSSIPDAITCGSVTAVNPALIPGANPGSQKYAFLDPAVKSACFTERSHILGIASGAALAFDSYHSASGMWGEMTSFFQNAFSFIFKLLIGLFVSIVYAISAIWLIFLVLDIVTRALMTAAFSPLFLGLYIFQPTRGVSVQAFKGLLGSMATAVALSIINVLAYVLITNTALVYEVTKADVVSGYQEWDYGGSADAEDEVPDLDTGDRQEAMRDFVKYVGEGNPDSERIIMDFGTPWFWYLAFCGVAIFALGKKMIRMVEDIVGYSGASEFANSALKSVKMGAIGAMVGTGATAAVASAGAGVAGKGLGYAGGYGGAAAGGALGSGMRGLGMA